MKITRESLSPVYFVTPASYLIEFIIWISLPQSHSLNGILGALWTLGQLGIIFTLYQIYHLQIGYGRKAKMLGVSIAAIGAFSYIFNYVGGYWLGLNTKIFLPLGALLTAVGMTIAGIQVLRDKRVTGVKSFAPLFVGLYPFLVMFPLLVITGHPDLTAIMGWGIPWLVLAYAMTSEKYSESVQSLAKSLRAKN